MRKITIGALTLLVVVLMVLTVVPGSTGDSRDNIFTNPSFENGTNGWTYKEYERWASMYGATDTSWSTEGSNSYHLWTQPNSVVGQTAYNRIEQDVDLTGVDEIVMDIKTGTLCKYHSSFPYDMRVRIYIDNNVEWATQKPTGGNPMQNPDQNKVFIDLAVDVSGYSGVHKFAFEMYSATHGSNLFPSPKLEAWIDNLRIGGILADVQVKPSNLHFNSNAKYLNVRVLDFPEDPDKSPVDIDGSTVQVAGFGTFVKFDKNVDSKYMGKVDRQIIMDAIGSPGNNIELKVTGKLNDGTSFQGICPVDAA